MKINQNIQIVKLSDVGMKRSQNEDFIDSDQGIGLVVLADGMGGYQAGEVASQMTVEIIIDYLKDALIGENLLDLRSADIQQIFQASSKLANQKVYHQATTQKECLGMGTTLVLAMFFDDRVIVGHIGDSRMYRYRYGTLTQITLDHSLLQEQLNAGILTVEQAKEAKNKNLVTRAVGVSSEVELDLQEVDLFDDDIYLLCSDGLSDMLDDEALLDQFNHHHKNIEVLATSLINAANQAGGKDNVSVILVKG